MNCKTVKLLLLGIIVLLIAGLDSLEFVFAQSNERGQSVKMKLANGQQVDFYDASYALVIGVSQYKNGMKNLPGVKTDMDAVTSALGRQGFQVTSLLDPDYRQFDEAIRQFIASRGRSRNGRLLIYYAGHGETLELEDGRRLGYLVPADAPNPRKSPEEFLLKAVSMDQIEVYAKQIAAKHAMFVFDSCFSGMLFLNRSTGTVPPTIENKVTYPVRQFITAGTESQAVPDESVFRKMFVRGLEGDGDLNRDGYITGSELGSYLEDQVANYTRRMQTPIYGKIRLPELDRGDMIFTNPNVKAAAIAGQVSPEPASELPALKDREKPTPELPGQVGNSVTRRRVLLLVTENETGSNIIRTVIADRLTQGLAENGLTVTRSSDIDSSELTRIKQSLSKLELESRGSGPLLNFSVVISGIILTRTLEPFQNLFAASAQGSLKAIDISTGQLIASEDLSGIRGFGNSQEQANANALNNAAQKASEKFVSRIVNQIR
jgi:hypothetical protein